MAWRKQEEGEKMMMEKVTPVVGYQDVGPCFELLLPCPRLSPRHACLCFFVVSSLCWALSLNFDSGNTVFDHLSTTIGYVSPSNVSQTSLAKFRSFASRFGCVYDVAPAKKGLNDPLSLQITRTQKQGVAVASPFR